MKKSNLLKLGFLGLFCAFTTLVGAQTEATVSWPWNDSAAEDSTALAAQEPEISATANYILTPGEVVLGSSLDYYSKGIRNWDADDWGDTYFTEVTANEAISSASDASTISFPIEIAEGYTFTPTNISMKAERDGTDGCTFNIVWVNSDENTIDEGLTPNRVSTTSSDGTYNQRDEKYSELSYDLTDVAAAESSCGLKIVITKLSSGKSMGFSEIVITGTLTNEAGDSIQITYTPAQGDEVSSISEIIIMADQAIALADEDNSEEILGNIYVQNLAGTVKTNIVDYESLYAEDDEYEEGPTVGLKLILADTLVAKGNYIYVIPDSTFIWGNMSDPTYNENTTITFSIDGTLDETDNDENLTLTPADGESVGTLSQIQVGGKISPNWNVLSDLSVITVTNEAGETVAVCDSIEDVYDAELDVAYNDAEIIYLNTEITEAGTYTLTIPAEAFNVGNDQNSLSPEITATYTVTGEVEVLTYSPAEGETVDAVNSISITANQEVGFLLNDSTLAEANITVRNLDGEIVATVVDYESLDNQDEVDADETGEVELITNGVKLKLDKTITAAGQYHYLIPDSILAWGDARQARAASGETYNEAITITFRVSGELEVDGELTCDPADGSTIASLSVITISCEDGVAPSYSGDEITITVNGDAYTDSIDCEPVEPEGEFDPYTECTITLSEAITTEGTVVVTIPAGYFIYGENDANSEEIVLTYTIDPTATGINGVTLNTNGNNIYYNLNGQRVSSPTKGIYILNGKKILVK